MCVCGGGGYTGRGCSACAYTHSLDAFLVDTDAPKEGFERLAEREGKKANGAKLQAVSHLLQDGRRLLLDDIGGLARFFGKLGNTNLF